MIVKQIASLQHPLVKHLVHLRQNSDYRYEHKAVAIEGCKMVAEVGHSRRIKKLLVTHEGLIPAKVHAEEIFVVDEAIMKKISGMQSPEGIFAEIEMPSFSNLEGARFVIALDHVSDPGNVGAILRTALAFGWDGAFLIGDGCDPYNEKALRAARGATFRMPLRAGGWSDFDAFTEKLGLTPVVADLDGSGIADVQNSKGCVLVMGNEAHGPSPELASRSKKVTIPMSGPMESLNVAVAGGILMYLLRRGS